MKTAASLIALRRRRKRSRKMPDTEENPNAGCAKKKIGSFLSARGAAIGAAVGSALVLLGSVLEEKSSWVGAIWEVVKSVLFQ